MTPITAARTLLQIRWTVQRRTVAPRFVTHCRQPQGEKRRKINKRKACLMLSGEKRNNLFIISILPQAERAAVMLTRLSKEADRKLWMWEEEQMMEHLFRVIKIDH